MLKEYQARCMRCREQRTIKNPQIITTKNNRKAVKGICPVCSTVMFRFLPNEAESPIREMEVKPGEEIKKGDAVVEENGKAISIETTTQTEELKGKPDLEETSSHSCYSKISPSQSTAQEREKSNLEEEIADWDKVQH